MIKGTTDGKYNLHFIDWDNEWEHAMDYQYSTHNECPIYGMSIDTFERLYDEFMAEEYKANGVSREKLKQIPIKTVVQVDANMMCAICIKVYEEGNKVFYLECSHHFHIECIKLWFDKNHICPNCRHDINTE